MRRRSAQTEPRLHRGLDLRQGRAVKHTETADQLHAGHTGDALCIEAAGIETPGGVRHFEPSWQIQISSCAKP